MAARKGDDVNTDAINRAHQDQGSSNRSPASEVVRQLGRKARDRLEEELVKRPEIVLLDELPARPENESSVKLAVRKSPQNSLPATQQRPKRRRSRESSRPTVAAKNVDRWLPNTSTIPGCTKDTRSNIVWLHGLPIQCTPAQIRRFFSGLDPEHVWIIPNINLHRVSEWDADHDVSRKKGVRVERYPPEFRVLVKFATAPTAEMASSRSGEVLSLRRDEMPVADNDDDEVIGASIAVTQLNRPTARYFMKHRLLIEARSGVSLETTLEQVDKEIDPLVKRILAAAVVRDLKLNEDALDAQHTYPLYNSSKFHDAMIPHVYEQLIEEHNKMLFDCNRLVFGLPFRTGEVHDPELLSDPIVSLTSSAVDVLKHDMRLLDDCLIEARRRRLFRLPSFSEPFLKIAAIKEKRKL